MPYSVALALVYGSVTDGHFESRELLEDHFESRELLEDQRVRNLVSRIGPKIDNSFSNANPTILPGTLEITTNDGRRVKFDGTGADVGGEFKTAVFGKI